MQPPTTNRDVLSFRDGWSAPDNGDPVLATVWRLVAVVFIILLLMVSWYLYARASARSHRERICEQLQIVCYCEYFFCGLLVSAIVPASLAISRELGHGAVWSGLLLSSFWMLTSVGGVCGTCLSKRLDETSKHAIIVCMMFICGVLSFLSGAIVQGVVEVPCNDMFLLLCRACLGACNFLFMGILVHTATKILSTEARVVQQVRQAMAYMAGGGCGPLLLWFLLRPVEFTPFVRFGLAVPFYAVAAFYMFHSACTKAVLHGTAATLAQWDSGSIPNTGAEAEESDDASSSEAPVPRKLQSDARSLRFRKLVYVLGNLYGIERVVVTGALEAATSYVLERIFHWDVSKIGFWVGIIYLIGAVVGLAVSFFKRKVLVLKWTSVVAVLSSVCLTAFVRRHAAVVLTVDLVLFSACYLACGVAEGAAMACAIPDTTYSLENVFLFRFVIKSNIGRCLAPFIVRSTIPYSTTLYCIIQVAMTVLGVLLSSGISHGLKGLWHATLTEPAQQEAIEKEALVESAAE